MSLGLLSEHEIMLNVGLGAETLASYTRAFHAQDRKPGETVTLWHVATVLPLAFHAISRRAISKRRAASGLRSILMRDPDNDIAQNEVIFDLSRRMRGMFPRSIRSLNCAVAWGLLAVEDGVILPGSGRRPSSLAGEAQEIVRAADKLGAWGGQLTSFEYFTILGVDFLQ